MEAKPEPLDWLLEAADKLTARYEPPIPLVAILKQFEIRIAPPSKQASPSAAHASLHREGEKYLIKLNRGDLDRPFSSHELFSVAHEFGHVLLIRRYNWEPKTKRDHYDTEEYCNRFAGQLIIPNRFIAAFKPTSAQSALRFLRIIMAKTGASPEVTARRLTEQYSGLAFCSARKMKNKAEKPVWRLWWGVSSHPIHKFNRGQDLLDDSPIADYLNSMTALWETTDIVSDNRLDAATTMFARGRGSSMLLAIHADN